MKAEKLLTMILMLLAFTISNTDAEAKIRLLLKEE